MTISRKEWLLLIHQIPLKPSYLRVKIWRRLQKVGSVALKQSVYILPKHRQAQEDFAWISREITEGGGEALLCDAYLLEGLNDGQVVSMFQAARREDYEHIIHEARTLLDELTSEQPPSAEAMSKRKSQLARLKSRFDQITVIDFFPAPERSAAEIILAELHSRMAGTPKSRAEGKRNIRELKGRTWVTRENVFVDRIASAWLIKRFVDRGAKFKFVASDSYAPKKKELRFDTYEGEYTHGGDRCTFEVMADRLGIADPALTPIIEIVHALDLKDDKYHRAETAGVGIVLTGIVTAYPSDKERVEKGGEIFNALYRHFQSQRRN